MSNIIIDRISNSNPSNSSVSRYGCNITINDIMFRFSYERIIGEGIIKDIDLILFAKSTIREGNKFIVGKQNNKEIYLEDIELAAKMIIEKLEEYYANKGIKIYDRKVKVIYVSKVVLGEYEKTEENEELVPQKEIDEKCLLYTTINV